MLVSWLTSLGYDDLVAEILRLADADYRIRALMQARACAETAEELIDDGAAHEAVELARAGLGLVTNALASAALTSSAAEEGTAATGSPAASTTVASTAVAGQPLVDTARELLDVHLRACRAADPPPGPAELGIYLANLILDDAVGLTPSLEDYARLLGRSGALAIRDRITAVFQANPDHPNARHLARSLGRPAGGDAPPPP